MAVLRSAVVAYALLSVCACSPTRGAAFEDAGADFGAVGAVGAIDAGSPVPCNVAAYCAANETCFRDDSYCASAPGTCFPYDGGCAPAHPVCACDGHIYSDACALRVARQNVGDDAKCDLPPGAFRCGHQVCTIATEYCDAYGDCGPLPQSCKVAGAGCDCFADSGAVVECYCARASGGDFQFVCPS
ncbi:MAG: hypothetical protein ABI183_26775 [Polyangiaceae bacterium]